MELEEALDTATARLDRLEKHFDLHPIPRKTVAGLLRGGATLELLYLYDDGRLHYADLVAEARPEDPPRPGHVAAVGLCAFAEHLPEETLVCWLSAVGTRAVPRPNPDGEGTLPIVLKSCALGVLRAGPPQGEAVSREAASRALAICTAALQRSGKLVYGHHDLTDEGRAYEGAHYPPARRAQIAQEFDARVPPRPTQPRAG